LSCISHLFGIALKITNDKTRILRGRGDDQCKDAEFVAESMKFEKAVYIDHLATSERTKF